MLKQYRIFTSVFWLYVQHLPNGRLRKQNDLFSVQHRIMIPVYPNKRCYARYLEIAFIYLYCVNITRDQLVLAGYVLLYSNRSDS